MTTRKSIRVLTFSFFLLMIGFFVAWQGGLLNRFSEPEEQPYKTLISRIPDTVKEVPLDIFKQEVIEQQQQPVSIVRPTSLGQPDPLMMASSKTMIISAPLLSVSGSPSQSRIKSLFEQPVRATGKDDIMEEPPAPDLRIFYGQDFSAPDKVYMMSTSKSTVIADPSIELRRTLFRGGQIESVFGPDTNTAKLKARFRKP